MNKKLSTRFAPSPTGYLHLGNCRLAVIGYLFAKRFDASYILRFDDTDTTRSKQIYIDAIKNDLAWLGINFDDSYKQSDYHLRYKKQIQKLIHNKFLYPCFETKDELNIMRKAMTMAGKPPIYDRSALKLSESEISEKIEKGIMPHYRFKLKHQENTWKDLAKGTITINSSHLSDPVLVREDQKPLYTLTSVCDDIESNITHIIRGEDHISNTAVQSEIFCALAESDHYQLPTFAHIPLVSSETGSNLSKRLGSLSIKELQEKEYLPEAIFSYLATLGTNFQPLGSENVNDWAKIFDFKQFSSSSPKFDPATLSTINNKYFRNQSFATVKNIISRSNKEINQVTWDILKDSANNFSELCEWLSILENLNTNELKLNDKQKKIVEEFISNFDKIDFTSSDKIKTTIEQNFNNPKDLFFPLRFALSQKKNGPKIYDLLFLVGKEKTKDRLGFALN